VTPNPGWEYISASVERLVGYSPCEFYTDSKLDNSIIHPDDRARLAKMANNPSMSGLLRWIDRAGRVIPMEHSNVAVYDEDGKLVAIEGLARPPNGPSETSGHASSVASLSASADRQALVSLTERELDVIRLVAEGKCNSEMAETLVISRRTVDAHVNNILRKLDVPNRTAAVSVAFRTGLLSLGKDD
jgi:DNA-binding CsgD family transcriptional regulator